MKQAWVVCALARAVSITGQSESLPNDLDTLPISDVVPIPVLPTDSSQLEALAGHSTVRMTEEYTKIQLTRQEELTRRIQERLASVGEKQIGMVQ